MECFDMTGGRGLHALHYALFSEGWRDAGLRVRKTKSKLIVF